MEIKGVIASYGFLRIKRGETVIDVGAFPGDFTIYASLLVKNEGKVISIEPHPENFRLLKKNLMNFGVGANVICVNKAISSYEGISQIQGSGWNAHLSETHGYKVEVVTLDKLLKDLDLAHVDVVKVDVEGEESAVLKGFQSGLKKVRDIAIETHSIAQFRFTVKFLEKWGFNVYVLNTPLLIFNIIKNFPYFISEIKPRCLPLNLLKLKYIVKMKEHPVPACRGKEIRIVYEKR